MFRHVSIALAFSASSVAMLLLNKGLVNFYEGSTLETPLLLQNVATLIMLISLSRVHLEDCTRDLLKTWSFCALLFCVNIYTSLMSMRYVNVPTFSVARNTNNFVTLALEMAILNYRPQRIVLMLLALCCIFAGTWLYAHEDISYNAVGYAWCVLHVCSMAMYAILVKRVTTINKDITSSMMSFCNCLLSLPIFVIISVLRNGHILDTRIFEMPRIGSICLAASCLMATAISVTGFSVQKKFPAIGYITLNNVSKIPAILLSMFLFVDNIDVSMGVGLTVSLFGGYAYAMSGVKELSSRVRTGLVVSMVATLLFTVLYVLRPNIHYASPLSYFGLTGSRVAPVAAEWRFASVKKDGVVDSGYAQGSGGASGCASETFPTTASLGEVNCQSVQMQAQLHGLSRVRAERWMVVTTIQAPTTEVHHLCNLSGWQGVVLGDTKTPEPWSSGTCIYLGITVQRCLGYSLEAALPIRRYDRKSLAYLFAIEHGARVIYETDDDNEPMFEEIVAFDEHVCARQSTKGCAFINPYGAFGRADIWPRGFPLRQIAATHASALEFNDTRVHAVRAPVQQGLADIDPDVDAVFRLTRFEDIGSVQFKQGVPGISLRRGTFAPFNSQNTVWHYSAFWGLLLPVTTGCREDDIWRGYWLQRLLWDMGGRLLFVSATAAQLRNPHDYMWDMDEELAMYKRADEYAAFLNGWRSRSGKDSMLERVTQLMQAMHSARLIGWTDVLLSRLWVQDLRRIGYTPPQPHTNTPSAVQCPSSLRSASTTTSDFRRRRTSVWKRAQEMYKSAIHLHSLQSKYK